MVGEAKEPNVARTIKAAQKTELPDQGSYSRRKKGKKIKLQPEVNGFDETKHIYLVDQFVHDVIERAKQEYLRNPTYDGTNSSCHGNTECQNATVAATDSDCLIKVSDEYVEDYGDLFKKYILNISSDDLAFDIPLAETTDNPADVDSAFDWSLVFNVISGIGILTNSILILLIIVDFIIDKERRIWARHWLLLNLAVLHITTLILSIIQSIVTYSTLPNTSSLKLNDCRALCHMTFATEVATSLGLMLLACHVLFHVFDPWAVSGLRQCLLWLLAILLTWVSGHVTVYAVYTQFSESGDRTTHTRCSFCLRMPDEYTDYIGLATAFLVPFCVSFLASFLALIGLCRSSKARSKFTRVGMTLPWRKCSAIFAFCVTMVTFLVRLPIYQFLIKDLATSLDEEFDKNTQFEIYKFAMVFFIGHFVLFPIVCLMLVEVRLIFPKALQADTSSDDSVEDSEPHGTELR